jgi:hypothetical protein
MQGRRHNLSAALTRLVGRTEFAADLIHLLPLWRSSVPAAFSSATALHVARHLRAGSDKAGPHKLGKIPCNRAVVKRL